MKESGSELEGNFTKVGSLSSKPLPNGFVKSDGNWHSSKNSFNRVKLQQNDDTESITNSSDDDQSSGSFCEEHYNVQIVKDNTVQEKNGEENIDDGYGFYDSDGENDNEMATSDSTDKVLAHRDDSYHKAKMSSPLSSLFDAEKLSIHRSYNIERKITRTEIEQDEIRDVITILKAKCRVDPDHRVLFKYVNERSSVICRSFSKLSRSNSIVDTQQYDHITASIQGFRIVQATSGCHHAEFIISVYINNSNFKIWKRYNRFETFADVLFNNMEGSSSANESEDPLFKARESWLDIQRNKSWFRDLSIVYLMKKTLKLELFLQYVVWGLETLDPFFDFLIDAI